jgi:hypothetical protein
MSDLADDLISLGMNDGCGVMEGLKSQNCMLEESCKSLTQELMIRDGTISDLTFRLSSVSRELSELEKCVKLDERANKLLMELAETRVNLRHSEKACSDLVAQVGRLEESRRQSDMSGNNSSLMGDHFEEQVTSILQPQFGGMCEVDRTLKPHCGDIHLRFPNNIMIMLELKNCLDGNTNDSIRAKDKIKFHEDRERCIPKPSGSILFARKRVNRESNIHSIDPTVIWVGGGDLPLLFRAVHMVYHAAYLKLTTQVEPRRNMDEVKNFLESLGSMHQTDVRILKDISQLISRHTTLKRSHIEECEERINTLKTVYPELISGPVLNAIGGSTSSKRKHPETLVV